MKKTLALILSSVLVLSLFAGCGSSDKTSGDENTQKNDTSNSTNSENADDSSDSNASAETNDITFVLDWTPNTNHTGLYVADALGYYKDAGINITIVQPPEDGATTMVASGQAQFGIDFQDYLVDALAIEEPMPVTAVSAIIQHNTSGIISLKEKGIDSPAKMENHSYATWELPIEQAMLKKIVADDGGNFDNVKLIPTYVEDVVAALNSDIESVWIYAAWDGMKAKIAGLDTNYINFADIDDTFDYYSPVIIANNDFLANSPDVAKAFLAATKKGYEYAISNPSEAADILLKAVPELDSELVHTSQDWLADKYQADASQWGIFDADRWNRFYSWLNDNGLAKEKLPENCGFTNDFIKE